MPNFRNLEEIRAYLSKKVGSALERDVADAVKEAMHDRVESDVYNAYNPSMYERRGSHSGGLGDKKNMKAQMLDDTTLLLTNETPPNPNYRHLRLRGWSVAKSVERGARYDYISPEEIGPRPFTKNTANELRAKKQHIYALVQSLKRQGITTK